MLCEEGSKSSNGHPAQEHKPHDHRPGTALLDCPTSARVDWVDVAPKGLTGRFEGLTFVSPGSIRLKWRSGCFREKEIGEGRLSPLPISNREHPSDLSSSHLIGGHQTPDFSQL